jgi:Histone-like transcription factor (CBF/NF-Y) and archaeal histone
MFTIFQLPLSRIKQIIKLDDEVDRVNADAVFIIAKAAVNILLLLSF